MYNLKRIKMKKKIFNFLAMALVAIMMSSCATVFGGKVSECQRTKPAPGEPTRAIRGGALIADVLLFWPGAIVDFATGAIYKPCDKN
ncbi:hypothetical protein SAMN05444285_1308 [Draconibacterium orientale]|uniref:Lipoprotein n=2 Tax=Draconibacterium orientale TaxID=1168034 RepID=A0A1I0I9X7_9BACT|nr:hypothetical protein SAMN05444285_1308 [Draconibacterium orientale]